MQISSIEVQKRNKDRCSVFVDGDYSFSLSIDQLIELGITKGKELGESDLQTYKDASNYGKLYDAAIMKLSRRQHSRLEIAQYLQKKKAGDEESEQIIAKLTGRGYINDQQFAELWVEQRRAFKKASNAAIRQELRAKGVSSSIIDESLDGASSESDALEALIQKKQHLSRYQDKKKFISYLLSKGFRYSDIQKKLDA